MYLYLKKYSSMAACHVLSANNLIYDFITSLARLIAIDLVLDKSEHLIFSYIGLNNEHPWSLFDLIEGEVDVETDELFDVEMLPFL